MLNIFKTIYGCVTYTPPNRSNQLKQIKKYKPASKIEFQVPIIAPPKIQVKNNPILEKILVNNERINEHEKQTKVNNFYATSLALKESEIPFYLDCGTLLGCIREGKILSHDTDVDVTIHLSMWNKLLTTVDFPKYGLTVKRKYNGFPNYSGGNMLSVHLTDDAAKSYCDIYANPAFPLLENATMNGKEYPVPKEPQLYLTQLYGNWQVPSGTHADTTYHRNNGLVLSNYKKNWDLKYNIYKCKF